MMLISQPKRDKVEIFYTLGLHSFGPLVLTSALYVFCVCPRTPSFDVQGAVENVS